MVEILLIIGLALILSNWLSEKFNLVSPLVLIAVGVLTSLIPGIPDITVSPDMVLHVFLPLLLYWEALNISLRGIKQGLRNVILNGTLMVLFVAVAVGYVGQLVGLTLGAALLIGAAVGPTDATAVAALGKGISPRQMIILRAESLINDGTALVVFALATEYAGEHADITLTHASKSFLISFVGGTVIGLASGWVISRIARYINNPMIANLFRLTIPFLVFFIAEEIEASGVLAVVMCGLFMSQVAPKFQSAGSRAIARPFFGMLSYILNSLLFLLVGLHLLETVKTLRSDNIWHALLVTVILYLVMMVSRGIFHGFSARLLRLIDYRGNRKRHRTTVWERTVLTTAGFRGAISLAVAFSIPVQLSDGEAFPYRDLIIFVTSGIVILSLLVQGALLPMAVKLTTKFPNPYVKVGDDVHEREINTALVDSTEAIIDELPELARKVKATDDAVERVRDEFKIKREAWMSEYREDVSNESYESRRSEERLRLETTRLMRENVIKYRDEGKIDDEALIYLLELIDTEEIRLTGPIEME